MVAGCAYYSDDLLNAERPNGVSGAAAAGGAPSAPSPARGGAGGTQGIVGLAGSASGLGAIAGIASAGASGSGATLGMTATGSGGIGADGAGGAGSEGGQGGNATADQCPNDPDKLEPGQCGCGVPETCAILKAALLHRYDFSRSGAYAVDTVGSANGAIVGAAAAQGKVTFDGTTAAYVDLPNGMISALKDASFEVWLEWGGGSPWQRIFDFGTSDKGEGNQATNAPTYLYLTPSDGYPGNVLRASFSSNGLGSEVAARAVASLPTGSLQHVVVVVDDTHNQLRLYLNGALSTMVAFDGSLSSLKDVNNWLGRSNFVDAPLKASIEEFRIYGVALDASSVAASDGFGPSPSFL